MLLDLLLGLVGQVRVGGVGGLEDKVGGACDVTARPIVLQHVLIAVGVQLRDLIVLGEPMRACLLG